MVGRQRGSGAFARMDAVIQPCLAAWEATDNTGGDPMAWSTSLDQPAPPS